MLVCGPELSDEEVMEIMEKVFTYVDVDTDGNISYEEVSLRCHSKSTFLSDLMTVN